MEKKKKKKNVATGREPLLLTIHEVWPIFLILNVISALEETLCS